MSMNEYIVRYDAEDYVDCHIMPRDIDDLLCNNGTVLFPIKPKIRVYQVILDSFFKTVEEAIFRKSVWYSEQYDRFLFVSGSKIVFYCTGTNMKDAIDQFYETFTTSMIELPKQYQY